MVETFDHWLERVDNMWIHDRNARHQRKGQWLYNNMPNRFVSRLPQAVDPFNNDENIENFIVWLKKNWDF